MSLQELVKEETHIIRVPTVVGLSKSKNWILNLNNYRNAHYQTLNKAKVNFKYLVTKEISSLPAFTEISSIEYILYRDSKRHCDVANVCSIVDKFFCDALVEAKKLPDDNYEFLKRISYQWGGIADTAFVEIHIKGKLKMQLQIKFDNQDIINAVKAYAAQLYPDFEKQISGTKAQLISSDKGVTTCELVLGSTEGLASKPNSNRTTGSRVSGSGTVSDTKQESGAGEAVSASETKAEFAEPVSEPAKSDVSEPESKPEPKTETSTRKSLFAKRAEVSSVGGTEREESTDSDNSSSSDPLGLDAANPSKVGVSIFGRKKIA